MSNTLLLEQTLKTMGGLIACQRCLARSKRTKKQCKAPAIAGRKACKNHGGASTGPKTEQGRQRCAEARTIHGNETRKARSERSLGSARLALLESVGTALNMFTGSRTRGPKPTRMSEAYPELQAAIRKIVLAGVANKAN
jgi:hypothetical protein